MICGFVKQQQMRPEPHSACKRQSRLLPSRQCTNLLLCKLATQSKASQVAEELLVLSHSRQDSICILTGLQCWQLTTQPVHACLTQALLQTLEVELGHVCNLQFGVTIGLVLWPLVSFKPA